MYIGAFKFIIIYLFYVRRSSTNNTGVLKQTTFVLQIISPNGKYSNLKRPLGRCFQLGMHI